MSFEPASPISIISCKHCQAAGCDLCDHHGIYALQDNQPIAFNLPDFIDFKTRRFLKKMLWIKRSVLFTFALIIIIVILSIFL